MVSVPLNTIMERTSVYSEDQNFLESLSALADQSLQWVGIKGLLLNDEELRGEKGVARGVTRCRDLVVLVDLKGLVDLEKERQRQEREIAKLQKGLKATEGTLNNPKFLEKAPPELVEEKRGNLKSYQVKIKEIEDALKYL